MEPENQGQTTITEEASENKPANSSVTDDEGTGFPSVDESEEGEAKAENEKQPKTTDGTSQEENETINRVDFVKEECFESQTLGDSGPTFESLTTENSKSTPELTLVLLGDPDAVETGSTLLLDLDKEKNEPFSSSLYDLCGRVISVSNLLGLQNIDQFPSNKGVHAFLLLLPHGLHVSHYKSGVQQLEATFGKGAVTYLMTVVTHESNEQCDRALTDLKAISDFDEKRYHTCTKSMRNETEILVLLQKIDAMVSENDPQCYARPQSEGQEGGHETSDSSLFQQNVTVHNLNKQTVEDFEESDVAEQGDERIDCQTHTEESKINAATKSLNKDTERPMGCNKEKDTPIKQPNERETETLLSRLQLQDRHNKLTLAEFLQIGSPLKHDQERHESSASLTFLKRLMMLDYRARYIWVKQHSDEGHFKHKYHDKSEENDLDAFCSSSVDYDQSHQTNIHPLDVQMAVFHCSDSFLKQTIVTKLSQCQYALPLLVPDPVTLDIECPLWTFRQIIKTWKISETKDNSEVLTMKSMPVCKAETPLVFCFRLGSLSVSKSQLMNSLINDRHNTFFQRNCPGSTKTRLLFDGVAEIAWYCPAGKPTDIFNDCVAFCNLHGDGLNHEKQLNILMDKSSVNVVFVPTLDRKHESAAVILAQMKPLMKSLTPLIVLIEDFGGSAEKIKKGKYKVGLKDRSQSDVSGELKEIIKINLSGSHKSFQLESMSKTGIRVDEDGTHCQQGLSAAKEIMEIIVSLNVSSIKSKFLPCQGKLWHDWCRINKEQYHLKGHVEMAKSKKQNELHKLKDQCKENVSANIETDKCIKQNQLQKLREDQCKASCSDLMKYFIKPLSSLPSTEREYFLKWTQILLDAHATDYLSLTLQNYDQKWSEVLNLKKKHEQSKELKTKQVELAELSKNLQSATCGLEHIYREMGQIYEAHESLEKPPESDQTDWSKYPELAAELMISGHPMELMDGDAGHVPLTWISGLIDEVIKKLGNKRVFVLSVLGIQSSGKSTMLNAMFGLQFAVSAGRCTRGVFMQLVKLSEDMKTDFKWDYILVVDTEGLRALELEGNTTIHHDNELATFVVGLGNMTLVNILGENPSEMQDILQIVVQAFMRMKQVCLSPSCVFVHQNVTDVAAVEKNMDGKRKLQDKLDQMVQLAAKEEVCDADSFSEVIEFDVQKDVKYFAQLWEGSPPMAPPNPGYSESVQDLKSFILSKALKSSGVTLSEFKTKVQDLWNALLNENFVFSFKNTLDIAVYRKLEVEFGNWTWALRSEMLTIEEQLYTRIENESIDQVDLKYLNENIYQKHEEIKKLVALYFDNDNYKEMLVQWRGQYELKIQEFCNELVRGLHRKLNDVIEQKKTSKKLDEKKTMFEDKLLQQSRELAHQLKDKAKDEEELKKQFDYVWKDWVNELTQGIKPIENIRLEQEVVNVLQHLSIEWSLVSESKKVNRYMNMSVNGDFSAYVGQRRHRPKQQKHQETLKEKDGEWIEYFTDTKGKVIQYLTGHLSDEDQHQIRDLIHTAESQSVELIKSKPVAKRGYSFSYLQEMALNVITNIGDFESHWKYSLRKEFKVDLLLYVFNRTEKWLLESHMQFIKNTDARTYLESKKGEYYSVFRSFCKGSSSAVVLAEVICEKLKASMTEAVCNRTAIDIAEEMRCSVQAFKGNRLNLEKHVLKSLAEKSEFKRYISYIFNPKTYIENIKEEVQHHLDTDYKEKSLSFLTKNVDNIIRLIKQALYDASEKTKTQNGDINMWLQEFSELIKDKLTFKAVSSQNVSDVNTFDFLREEIEKGLVPICKDLKSLSLDKMKEFRLQPDQILIDHHCNCCWETCPFCEAVCTNTVNGHEGDHSVPFHRSPAVKGLHYKGLKDLSLSFCTTKVASDGSFYHDSSDRTVPYKLYRTASDRFKNWSIIPDQFKLSYWQWVVCKFEKKIEKHYDLKFTGQGEIPDEWRKITDHEAIQSLEDMYK